MKLLSILKIFLYQFIFVRIPSGRAIRCNSSLLRRCGLSTTIPYAKPSYIFCIKLVVLFLVPLFFIASYSYAQNINKPNKLGPMGTEVNTATGNLFIKRTDIYIPARDFDIDLTFFYNAYNYDTTIGFGKGWSCNYNIQYKNDTANGKTLIWGDGREDAYKFNGTAFKAPKGFFNTLSQYQPNKYLLTELNGIKFYFDNAVHKKITKIESPNGNFINFIYTDTLLTRISNAAGQSISFNYNPLGNLASLVDSIATPTRTYTYTYDTYNNLTKYTDPLNGAMQYTYLINGPMKTMTDKNNNTIDIIYYNNYATREIIGCNKRQSFSYDTATNVTIVTDYLENGNNQITKYEYQKFDNLIWLKKLSGNCCGFNMQFEFDTEGNKIKETDANGNITQFNYDNRGNVISITDALNQTMYYTYNTAFNTLQSYTDNKGNKYQFTYDSNGNLTQLIEPGNNTYTATYNANGDLISSTDAKGNQFTYNYDSNGNPSFVTGPNGYNATLSIDGRGNLLSTKDARNNTITLQYDILNRLKTITDPISQAININYDAQDNITNISNKNNETSTFKYDASNRVVKTNDAIGNKINITYDAMNNVVAVQNSIGNTNTFTYDNLNRINGGTDAIGNRFSIDYYNNGNVKTVQMPNGLSRSINYDKLNRIIEVSDNNGIIGKMQYDANSNTTQLTTATGAVINATYDNLNRLKTITDPLGYTTAVNYDNLGLITNVVDKNGNSTSFTYDSSSRVKTYTDAIGGTVTLGYDAVGNIVSLKDQNNNITTYNYDSLNRVRTIAYPDGKFVQYTYDKKSNIIAKKMPDGTTLQFQYDSINRPIAKILPDGHAFTYTYDAINRVKTASNNAGTVTFNYDNLNRLISESFDNKTTYYNYDIPNRTQSIIYPDSTIITKNFDIRNNLIKVAKNGQNIVDITYNNANQILSKTFANGVVTNYQYDVANRLINISTKNGSIQNTSFTYDKVGNKKTILRSNNPLQSESFEYDAAYRMTGYKRGIIGGTTVDFSEYTYDLLGNRLTADESGVVTTYTTNNLNQITNSNNSLQNINFSYDNNGNQTYNGTFYKKYDAESRLLMDSASPTNKITYQYDAFGRRSKKNTLTNSFKYGYSGISQIELRDGYTDTIINKTIYSNYLMPLVNDKNGKNYYYHQNELGSIEHMSNNIGNNIENYSYHPFGTTKITDAVGNQLSNTATGNRFGFTGQELDSETDDYHFYFRKYNTATGTFYQRDLIGYTDGMGMYQYVGNNPANGVDVLGLSKKRGQGVPCPDAVDNSFSSTTKDIIAKLSKLQNYLSVFNVSNNKTKGLAVANLLLKIADFERDMNKHTDDENLAELTDIEMATIGIANDLKMFDGIPVVGQTLGKGLSVYGRVDAAVSESLPGNTSLSKRMALFYAGLDDGAVARGLEPLQNKNSLAYKYAQRQFNFNKEHMWAVRMQHGDNPKNWTDEDKEINDKLEQQKALNIFQYTGTLNWDCPQNGPTGGTQKPAPLGAVQAAIAFSEAIASYDPNEIIGPKGQPNKAWVSINDRLPYTITFENDKSASAPAKYIRIATPIEPKQDAATFQLGSFGFNSLTFSIPPNTPSYYNRLDVRDSLGLYVDITAGFDVNKNEAFWEFQSIDPVTLLTPTNPLVGLLLLQDSTKPTSGHGFGNFSIKPKLTSVTLDTIVAKASIVFDSNDTIPTNLHINTIDAVAPTTVLAPLPAVSANPVTLNWSSADDANGSGVKSYNIYISNDEVNYSILASNIKRTDTSVALSPGVTYYFFVLATDTVDNVETFQISKIKSTTIAGAETLPITGLLLSGITFGKINKLIWTTQTEIDTDKFKIERSLNGIDYTNIGSVGAAGNSSIQKTYYYTDSETARMNATKYYYRIKQIDRNSNFTFSNIILLKQQEDKLVKSIVFPNPVTDELHIGIGSQQLIGTMALIYNAHGQLVNSIKITSTVQKINMALLSNGTYFVKLQNKEAFSVVKK